MKKRRKITLIKKIKQKNINYLVPIHNKKINNKEMKNNN